MGDGKNAARGPARPGEIEITVAAIGGYGRLLGAVRRRIRTYASGDGGLICEDRTFRARPTMWRIAPNGAVLPDSPYDFCRGTFIAAGLPWGVPRTSPVGGS
jgi:hypothetical protein